MSATPAWMATLTYDIISDPYISKRHGFEIIGDNNFEEGIVLHESGLLFSSRCDAEDAAEELCHFAWMYRAWHTRSDEAIGGLQIREHAAR